MAYSFGYMIDMSKIQLSETEEGTWIQAMPLGEYMHPQHGLIKFTPERVKNFSDSVNNNVRGTALDIDYDHKAYHGAAAGWVKAAEARTDGLYLLVDFTPAAKKQLADKEYRYFSPEFIDKWTHPKSGLSFTDVLFGGGITNRPFLKDIQPVNLSELVAANDPTVTQMNEGGKNVTDDERKAKAVELGLTEDATSDEILAHIIANPVAVENEGKESDPESVSEVAASDPVIAAAKKLGETNPELKAFTDLMIAKFDAQQVELSEASATLRLTEVSTAITSLTDTFKAKNYTLSPVVQKKLTEFVLSMPSKKLTENSINIIKYCAEMAFVALGEKGRSRTGDADNSSSAIVKMSEKATALMKTENISMSSAMKALSESDPDLFAEYREETYNPAMS